VTAEPSTGPLALIPVAAQGFSRRVHEVPAGRWQAPTPLDEWSVRDLVNHVASEHLWAPHLLRGETLEQVGDRYDGDVLSDDPVAAWDDAIDASLTAWRALPAEPAPVHTSVGPTPVEEYADQMLMDLVVHAWDLARGAGLDERLDRGCVEHVLAFIEPRIGEWRGYGIFKDPVPTDSTDPQDRLVALTGRDPRPPR
jgi:uncharacterized protein (TIGR03086 family)